MADESPVNENTTETSGPIEVKAGEMFSSFDELEGAKAVTDRHAPKKGTPTPPKPIEEEPEHISDEAKEKARLKAEKAPKEPKAKESKDPDSEKAQSDKDKLAAAKLPAAKAIKIKNGEEETELPVTAKIPVKVNGEDKEVTLEELRNEYSGKQNWAKQFGELGTEKAKFMKEKEIVTSKLGEMFALSEKDPMAGLMKMAEMAGMDPLKYRQDFLTGLEPVLAKRLEMSDDQRRAEDAEAELAFYRNQTQSRTQRESEAQAYQAFESEITQRVQQAGLSNDSFRETYFSLEKLVQSGDYKPESGQLTPDDVIKVALTTQSFEVADAVMTEIAGDLPQELKQSFYAEFIPMAVAQKLSASEIKAVVQETFRDHKAANLSKKVRKNQPDLGKGPSAPRNPASEPVSFEDL